MLMLMTNSGIKLRHFNVSDAQQMFTNWAHDSLVTKYLTWTPHQSQQESLQRIQSIKKSGDQFIWGIEWPNQQLVGEIAVVHLNNSLKIAEVGYVLGSKWWNQGIMKEVLARINQYLLLGQDLQRVECCYDLRNSASGAVMKNSGMHFEGVDRLAGITCIVF